MIDNIQEIIDFTKKLIELKQSSNEDKKNKNINMVSVITKSGETIYTDAELFEAGVEVYFLNGEEKVKIEVGEYELEDGSIVVIGEGSVIAEIKEVEIQSDDAAVEAEEPEMPVSNDMEAIKGMLENISMKLDMLIETKMAQIEQSVVELTEKVNKIDEVEVKVEKLSVEAEMKSVETIDDVKKVAQNAVENKKARLDYNMITKLNKKF